MIWSVREPTHVDIQSAKKFGTVCHIFHRSVSPLDLPKQTKIILKDVIPHASKDDLILTVGPQIMFGNLVALWVQNFGQVHFLVWNSSRRHYEKRWVTQPNGYGAN